jgi:hypothetical protein
VNLYVHHTFEHRVCTEVIYLMFFSHAITQIVCASLLF